MTVCVCVVGFFLFFFFGGGGERTSLDSFPGSSARAALRTNTEVSFTSFAGEQQDVKLSLIQGIVISNG